MADTLKVSGIKELVKGEGFRLGSDAIAVLDRKVKETVKAAIVKAKQIIDELGDRLFRDG